MSIRITQDVLYQNSLLYLQRGLNRLNETQIPLLTGKRINAPSDDPFNTIRSLKTHEEREGINNYLSNIQVVRGYQEASDSALQSLSTILAEAKSLTIQGANGSLNQLDRDAIAVQIDGILEEVVSLANTHYGGRFIFGGTQTTSAPYQYEVGDTVTYSGDSNVSYTWISPGIKIAMNTPGPQIFQNRVRGATLFDGNTGAAPGSGTDSGKTNDTLSILHGTTTYGGTTGVTAGASSAAGDTIIGAAGTHTLTVTVLSPTTGTISLDDGTAIPYDTNAPDAADFLVTNGSGDRVYVDLTAGPLSSGTDDITSTGYLSTDGGLSTVLIDFSANQVVHDTSTGTVTNVDSSQIVRTGEEYVTYSGTFDLFETLMAIRDDLSNTRGLSEEDQLLSISSRLAELDDVHQDALSALSEFGGRLLRLEMTEHRLESYDLKLAELISEIEDADITEAIMHLEQATQGLELAQLVTNRIMQASLAGVFQ